MQLYVGSRSDGPALLCERSCSETKRATALAQMLESSPLAQIMFAVLNSYVKVTL